MAADLQQQLLEQQQKMNRLRDQIANLNQMPYAHEVPPWDNTMPPVAPHIPEVNQGIPRNPEVPLAPAIPAGIQAIPLMVREKICYTNGLGV